MRLDQLLHHRGFFPSLEKAHRAVMAGTVQVDGKRVDKPGTPTSDEAELVLSGCRKPFVSRAGGKLSAALDHFGAEHSTLDPRGCVCLDVGASTGGFTDCLLQRGAVRVYALDVGYGQLDYSLRTDPRVVVMERLNARHLAPDALPEPCDLITIDVSFISLTKVVPALLTHMTPGGWLLPMIKPQFEADRDRVGEGGIVRDQAVRREVIDGRVADLEGLGLRALGVFDSPVSGVKGNREAFVLFESSGDPA